MSKFKNIIVVMLALSGLCFSWIYLTQSVQSKDVGCKNECYTCASTCEQTLSYCRNQAGKHLDSRHIKALQDCISTCKQSSDFMQRDSALQTAACHLCEKACANCAEFCSDFKSDKVMQACAEECRKCAQSCSTMSR